MLGVETPKDPPEKPKVPEKCVGIDVGILTYAHDTDGHAIESVDLSDERRLRSLREPIRFLHSAFARLRLAGCQTQSDNVLEAGSPTLTREPSGER